MKTLIIVALSLLIGVVAGQWSEQRHITKVYEDGSFYGCYSGGLCND